MDTSLATLGTATVGHSGVLIYVADTRADQHRGHPSATAAPLSLSPTLPTPTPRRSPANTATHPRADTHADTRAFADTHAVSHTRHHRAFADTPPYPATAVCMPPLHGAGMKNEAWCPTQITMPRIPP